MKTLHTEQFQASANKFDYVIQKTQIHFYIFSSYMMFEHYKLSFKIKKFYQTKQLTVPFASLDIINTEHSLRCWEVRMSVYITIKKKPTKLLNWKAKSQQFPVLPANAML